MADMTGPVTGVTGGIRVKAIAKTPVSWLGKPDDVSRVVEFLAAPDSVFIIGHVFSGHQRLKHVSQAGRTEPARPAPATRVDGQERAAV